MNYETYRGVFNADINVGATPCGEWDVPFMCRVDACPPALVAYDRVNREEDHSKWVHFCLHDQRFMSLWRDPWKNLPRLQRFGGVIAPDFSVFWKYPRYIQFEAVCRSRAIGAWLQRNACGGVPFMRWGLKGTYGFCFDAVEPGGTVAVGTIGCFDTKEARKVFEDGFGPMCDAVKPNRILVIGSDKSAAIDEARQDGIEVVAYEGETARYYREKEARDGLR